MKNQIEIKEKLDLIKAKEDFISYLDVSSGTLQTYKEGLKNFFEYLNSNDIKYPTRNDLRGYREFLKESLSICTINNYLSAIRRFFKYLELNDIYENITKDIKSIKVSKIPKKQVLTIEQVQHIYNNLTDLREKCLVSLAFSTGLRGIEMANAMIEDIQTYNDQTILWVQVKGHNAKDEYVKLSQQVINDINNYVGNRTSGYIFVSNSNHNKGGGITTKTLRLEIKNIFKRFGLDSDVFSLHTTRRTFATIGYLNGADIYELQQVLHHKSSSTTTRYINQSVRDNFKTELNVSNVVFGG